MREKVLNDAEPGESARGESRSRLLPAYAGILAILRPFRDWQATSQGERLVQKELRRALLKYKLHTDQELFDKAYGYIRQYY